MRLFLTLATTLLASPAVLLAQTRPAPAPSRPAPQERIALSSEPAHASAAGTVLTCPNLTGQVLDENGHPLVGATVALAGTSFINSTNADGYFVLSRPAKAWQRLRISAAGYADAELPVEQCHTPAVTLKLLPGTRVKQGKKHYGKIMKVGQPAR